MKKLSLFLLLVIASAIFAEKTFAQIDVVLGLSKTSITGGSSWKDPIGFQVGALMPVLKFNESLHLIAEANISKQGARWEESTMSGTINLWYINVPVCVRYQAKNGIYFEGGLQPGLLLSAKEKYDDIKENVKDYMNIFDLSIPVGVGYQINEQFGVAFRVIPGISDITEDDEADRNLVFVLRGTYRINLGK